MLYYKLLLIVSWFAFCTLHIMHGPMYWGGFAIALVTSIFGGICLLNGESAFKKKLPWFSIHSLLITLLLFVWFLSFIDGRYTCITDRLGISQDIIHTLSSYIAIILILTSTPLLLFITFNIGESTNSIKHRLISFFQQRELDIFKIRFSHSSKYILVAPLLFLALPNICFLLGWVQWYLAVPIILCICVGIFVTITYAPHRVISYSYANVISLSIGFLLCMLLAECMGFMGQVEQSWDLMYRNAFYHTLVSEPWPIFSSRNEYFVYYHAFWLPPAFISKIIGEAINPMFILTVWGFFGLFTVFLILHSRIKARAIGLLILVLTIGSLYDVAWIRNLVLSGSNEVYAYFVPIWCACIRDIFHAGIPTLIVLSLGYSKLANPFSYYFVAALILATSPLQSVAFIPLLVYWTWPCLNSWQALKQLICGVSWLAIPLVACVTVYFSLCNESAGFRWIFENSKYTPQSITDSNDRIWYYANTVLLILIPYIMVLRRKLLHSPYTILVLILAFALPLCWIGRWVNELLFKGSIVILFLVAISYSYVWVRSKAHIRCLLILFFISCSYFTILDINTRIIQTYSRNPSQMQKNINNDWEQHINHPNDPNYCHFFGKLPPSNIFYDTPGNSPVNF